MGKTKKDHFFEVQFSLPSLVGLLLCWVGIALTAFYLGFLMGRTDQMEKDRKRYAVSEVVSEDENVAQLTFTEELARSETDLENLSLSGQDGKGKGRDSQKDASGPGETVSPVPPPVLSSGKPPSEKPSRVEARPEAHVLQVASFREKERAETLVSQLKKKGYSCFHSGSTHPVSNRAYFRVFVGPVSGRKEADRIKSILERDEGFQGILIRSVTPKE